MTLELKPTEATDLPKIMEWEVHQDNRRFVGTYSQERHLQVITDPNERHFKFLDGINMIGYTILAGFTHQHRFFELRRIVISQKGQGYGRQALRLIKDYCFDEANCHRLWLDVFDFNHRARKLYLTEGFKEEGILLNNNGDANSQSLILMSLS